MGITDGLMTVANTLRAADKISEYKQILDAMERIAELQLELQESRARLVQVQTELDAIKADQMNADQINEFYQLFELKGRYYCRHCWIVDKRLGPVVFAAGGHGRLQCTRCKQDFAWSHNPIQPGS